MFDREDVRKSIYRLRDMHELGTYVYKLGKDDFGRIWALVFAWQDGYEKLDDNNPYHWSSMRIAMKIAWKSGNAIMDDYDMDWLFPYTSEFTDDCEVSLESDEEIDSDLDYMEETFERYQKEYFDKEMEY